MYVCMYLFIYLFIYVCMYVCPRRTKNDRQSREKATGILDHTQPAKLQQGDNYNCPCMLLDHPQNHSRQAYQIKQRDCENDLHYYIMA